MLSSFQKYHTTVYREFCWKAALTYLEERADIKLVREHMQPPEKPKGFPEIFKRLLESLPNKRNMPKAIGQVEELEPIFFGFDHQKTLKAYGTWENLFDTASAFVKHSPKMDKSNPHNYWVIFCKGSLSAAHYLDRFSTSGEFLEFVSYFDTNMIDRLVLPCLLEQEIFGYGFALACDFIKEIGFSNYSKPDRQLIDIFSGLSISSACELDVFRTVTSIAEEIKETPYAVDKAFWLIGSGNLYRNKITFKTNKDEFVKQVRDSWDKVS